MGSSDDANKTAPKRPGFDSAVERACFGFLLLVGGAVTGTFVTAIGDAIQEDDARKAVGLTALTAVMAALFIYIYVWASNTRPHEEYIDWLLAQKAKADEKYDALRQETMPYLIAKKARELRGEDGLAEEVAAEQAGSGSRKSDTPPY